MSKAPHFGVERRLARDAFWPVAGIDEAGRGPLAGPVAAAAVILDPRKLPYGVDDSKRLSSEARDAFYAVILRDALAVSIAFASPGEIDAVNIRQATFAAMRRAAGGLSLRARFILIDGADTPPGLACGALAIVRGDASSLSIAAASIVAKVTRDRLMRRLATLYPHYGFDAHVGYGTPDHLAAIVRHGPCPFHRLSFSPFKQMSANA